jgi:LmbE family N-acetylglucosaminyl deacetylase
VTTLFLLAHYDDEYCALPLILQAKAAGEPMLFCYTTQPPDPAARRRRARETVAFLAHYGAPPPLALAAPADDGRSCLALPALCAALEALLAGQPPLDRIVTPAWEGGHVDHDACAVLAVALAAAQKNPCRLEQFSLYQGLGLPGPLFHGGRLLEKNGPPIVIPLTARQWRSYAAAVRFFPSQAGVWSTLWPALVFTWLRQGYAVQGLDPGRVRQRPHDGPLLYERRGLARYEDVAASVAAFLG